MKMRISSIKLLPIVHVILIGAMMYVSSELLPYYDYDLDGAWILSITTFLMGAAIIVLCGMQFRKASTTVNPLTPDKTRRLVVTGIYAYSRNPMYVGFLLFLISLQILLANMVSLIFLPIFIVVINRLQIQPEETVLEELFGEEYRQYMKNVRRWI